MDNYNIYNLPPRLFKYYSYNTELNVKRLTGEVYLACPFDFNDPCDCQREVINNSKTRVDANGADWLRLKMKELDYSEQECEELANSLLNDDSKVREVHIRMLERMGILCLTSKQADTLMWGYYANNDGLCIQYDEKKIIRNLVIGYINKMSYTTTRFLFQDEKYFQIPEQRTQDLGKNIIEKANNIIRKSDIEHISNMFLDEQIDKLKILNFARNILLKRMYAQPIIYNVSPDGSPSPLFFNRDDKASKTKYFKKTRTWEHENEFRIIVSLGGRLAINIGKECIKNVYLGCNMPNERILGIAYLMEKHKLTAGLYKMKRLKNCGLKSEKIEWKTFKTDFDSFEENLNRIQ